MVNAFNGEFQMRKDNCRMKADSFAVGVDCTLSPVLPELKKSASETLSSSSVSSTNCLVKRVVCSPDLPVYPLSIVADSTAAAASTAVSRLSYPSQQAQQQQPQPQQHAAPSQSKAAAPEDEEEEQHSYQCNLCDKSFGQLDALTDHLKIHNGTHSGVNVSGKDPEDPYRCNCCGKTFAVPARLTRHYRTHTGEKPYQCEFCNKSFSVKENLSVHKRIHTKERPYKCDVCDRAFEHSGKLHRHMRIHTGERPHKCNYCAKTFIQSGQLVIHLRTHTGEKPYVCKCCGKGFTCSKQLKVHTRTHTGEKPYACDICGKSFGYNHVLKLHQVAHYGEKVYKCTICKETFNSKKAMETHIKMAHSESNQTNSGSAASASSVTGRMNGGAADGLASGGGGGGGGEGSSNSSNSSSSSDKENKLEIIEMTAAVPTQPMIPSSVCSSTGFTFEQGSSYIIPPQVMAKGDLTIIPIGCAGGAASAATVIGPDDGNLTAMCGGRQQQPLPPPPPPPHQQQYDGYAYGRCLTSDKPVEQSVNGSSVQCRFATRPCTDGGQAAGLGAPTTNNGSAIVYGEEQHGANSHFRAPLCYAGTQISSSSPSLSDSSRSNSPKLEIVENAAPEDCSHLYPHGNVALLDQHHPLPPSAMNEDACDSYLANNLIEHVSRYGNASSAVTRSPLFSYTEQQTIISSNSANNSTSFVTIYSVPLPESCTPPSSTSTSPVPSSPDANAPDAPFTVDRDESNLPPRKRSKMILKSMQKAKAEETSGVRYSSVIHYAKSN